MKIDFSKENLWKILQKELNNPRSGLGQVLHLHLYCEFFLEELIKKKCTETPEAEIEGMRFKDKRKTVFDLKLIDDTLNQDLIAINGLRNIFAHNLDPDEKKFGEMLESHSNCPTEVMRKKMSIYLQVRHAGFDTVYKLLDI